MRLRDKVSYLEALKKSGSRKNSINIESVYHFSVDMFAKYLFLQVIYINVFQLMHYSLNSTNEKAIKELVDGFNHLDGLQSEIAELMEQYATVDKIRQENMGTKHCKCEYCKQLGENSTSGFLTPNSQKIFPFALDLQETTKGKVFYYD
jgi:hypothetical protein